VIEVDVAGGDEGVDARLARVFQSRCRALDVLLPRPREPANPALAEIPGDGRDGFEVAVARDGEAGLDHVDPQTLELARQGELLGEVHAATGRLLAVAQRGVEDANQIRAHGVILAAARSKPLV
jgi:hypothetical protein